LACAFAESVKTRGWRLLRSVGFCPWILPPDRVRSERLFASPLPLSFGRVFDLLDHALDLMTVLLGGEMLPAGQGYQGERFRFLEILGPLRLASLLGQVFCRPVDPDPLQRRAGEEGWRGMDAGPLTHSGHEIFLDPIREHIGEPGGLGGVFVADDGGLIATGPDLVLPAGEADDLTRELGIEKAHKARELLDVLDADQ